MARSFDRSKVNDALRRLGADMVVCYSCGESFPNGQQDSGQVYPWDPDNAELAYEPQEVCSSECRDVLVAKIQEQGLIASWELRPT